MKYNRGGKSLKVGDIGRMSVLRQHLLLPGERMKTSIRGNVRLSGLRQQTSVYLNAQIEAFAAPLRWYYSAFPDYLQEGVSTAKTIPILTGLDWTANRGATSQLGIGNIKFDVAKWYAQHPIKVWNEHYRWPAFPTFLGVPVSLSIGIIQFCVNHEPTMNSAMHFLCIP